MSDAAIAAVLGGEPANRRDVALEIAAGEAKPGVEIGMRADAAVEPQRRHDLVPVGADALAQLRHRVGDADRGDQAQLMEILRELGALEAHRQDRTAEALQIAAQHVGQAPSRIGAADDEALRIERALDGAPEDQRLDLIVECAAGALTAPREAGRNLAENDDDGVRRERRLERESRRAASGARSLSPRSSVGTSGAT